MHISIRYGSKGGLPIYHLEESIKEGRVSPRGRAGQGWLLKKLKNHRLLYPGDRVSLDLRASNDQIIAVGVFGEEYWDGYEPSFWSGDVNYVKTWSVEWKQIFHKPLTPEEFCQRFGVKTGYLERESFHHAMHQWDSPKINLSSAEKGDIGGFLEEGIEMLKDEIKDIDAYLDGFLKQAFAKKDYNLLKKNLASLAEVLSVYPKEEMKASSEWKGHLKITSSTKKKKKKGKNTRKKLTTFDKKVKKRIKEAVAHGITGDYAMATYFTRKRYRTRRGGTKWSGVTIKGYRTKFGI